MKSFICRFIFYIILLLLINQANLFAQWVQTNGPYGGNIFAFTSITNEDGKANIFAGTSRNGVFLSTNMGNNWIPANEGLPKNFSIFSLASFGTNLYATLAGEGVYFSSNNGDSWVPVNSGLTSKNVWPLVVSDSNIFVGTWDSGIFRSTDSGNNWVNVISGLTNLNVRSLAIDGNNIFAGTENGIFLSTNNGKSWVPINSGLTSKFIFSIAISHNDLGEANIFIGTYDGIFLSKDNGTNWIQVGLANEWIMFITVSGTNIFAGTNGNGVFLSTNNGTNWVQVISDDFVVNTLFASGENLFAGTGGGGIMLSTNNGTDWMLVNSGLKAIQLESLTSSSDKNGESSIFACSWGGIFRSNNNGLNWELVNNFPSVIYSLAVCESNIFASTWGWGIIRSSDNGTTWLPVNSGLPRYVTSLMVDGTKIFAGTWEENGNESKVFVSTNNGESWTEVGSGLPANALIWSLAIKGSNLFAGTGGGVFRYTSGENWVPVNEGLKGGNITSIAVSGNNLLACSSALLFSSSDNGENWIERDIWGVQKLFVHGPYVFVGGYNKGVFLSTNNGNDFIDIGAGLPDNYQVTSLIVSNTNVFVGTKENDNVWKRSLSDLITNIYQMNLTIKDSGNTLQTISFGQLPLATDSLDAIFDEALLQPPLNGFDARFCLPSGDESWKDFRSSNLDSAKWLIKLSPGESGYPITFQWDNKMLPKGNFYLRDLTTGSIVNVNMKTDSSFTLTNTNIVELKIIYNDSISIPSSIAKSKDLLQVFILSQNYPNPFNPSTKLKYCLPQEVGVKLIIYNILGQEVQTLVNKIQKAGNYEVMFNASNLPSGIYFYKIQAGNFIDVKKMILTK